MRYNKLYVFGAMGVLALIVGLLFYRRMSRPTEGFEDVGLDKAPEKSTDTITEQEMKKLISQPREGDAMDLSLEGQLGTDMPRREQIGHYRQGSDIIDDFYGDSESLTPHMLDLTEVSTYRQEINSSQLAMQAIQHPYYEMNLSQVIRGTVLPALDPRTSRHGDGSYFVVNKANITPPIILDVGQTGDVVDIGNGGLGGISMD